MLNKIISRQIFSLTFLSAYWIGLYQQECSQIYNQMERVHH